MKRSRTVELVSDPLGTKLLTFVLSVIAGSVDVIGFLGLGSLVHRPRYRQSGDPCGKSRCRRARARGAFAVRAGVYYRARCGATSGGKLDRSGIATLGRCCSCSFCSFPASRNMHSGWLPRLIRTRRS